VKRHRDFSFLSHYYPKAPAERSTGYPFDGAAITILRPAEARELER
jgi:hypothetical protein